MNKNIYIENMLMLQQSSDLVSPPMVGEGSSPFQFDGEGI